MRHPENLTARYERWFPEQVDFEPPPPDLGRAPARCRTTALVDVGRQGDGRGAGRLPARRGPPAQHLPPAVAVDPAAGPPPQDPDGDDVARLQAGVPHVPVPGPRRDLRALHPPSLLGAGDPSLQRRFGGGEQPERRRDDAAHGRPRLRADRDLRLSQPVPARQDAGRSRLPRAPALDPELRRYRGVHTQADTRWRRRVRGTPVPGEGRRRLGGGGRGACGPAPGRRGRRAGARVARGARPRSRRGRSDPVPRPPAHRRAAGAAAVRERRGGAVSLVREHAARGARGVRFGPARGGDGSGRRARADRAGRRR